MHDVLGDASARPLYLSGALRPELVGLPGVGYMRTPQIGNRVDSTVPWAADNGCYRHPELFDLTKYLRWLDRQERSSCLFVTAPDIPGDPWGSFDRAYATFPLIRALGYEVALVAQDGFDLIEDDRWDWDLFDWLFIGGSTAWKVCGEYTDRGYGHLGPGVVRPDEADWLDGAYEAVRLARDAGKRVHMGRVNGARRYALAAAWGCESVDGTYLAHAPRTNLPRLLSWVGSTDEAGAAAA